jgi:hypothetical protein
MAVGDIWEADRSDEDPVRLTASESSEIGVGSDLNCDELVILGVNCAYGGDVGADGGGLIMEQVVSS